jgi:hypothetical protein
MTRKSRGWGLVIVIVVAILASVFVADVRQRALTAKTLELSWQMRRSALETRFRIAQRDRQTESGGPEKLRSAVGRAGHSLAETAPAKLASSENRATWFSAHPDVRSRYLKAFRDGLGTTWGFLFQTLNLSDDQQEKLKDLLAQREDNDITVEAAAAARGVDESDPEIQALDDQLDAANKAAIQALVGKADYHAIRQYMHAEAVIPVVDALAGNLYGSDAPLTAEEATSLTQALVASSQQKASGRAVAGTLDWDQAGARAQSILTPAQFGTFAVIQQQGQAEQQLKQLAHSFTGPVP